MRGNTGIYGIVGEKISYSLSPIIYRSLFQKHNIDGVYNSFDIPAQQLKNFMGVVRTLPLAGFNVTIPYKESLVKFTDKRDGVVTATGSTNLVINKRGVLCGYNTDIAGIAATIEEKLKLDLHGANVVILGSGGSARTVFHYLVTKRAGSVTVYHRSQSRQRQFSVWAEESSKRTKYRSEMMNSAKGMNGDIDLCINCTPMEISELIGTAMLPQLPKVFELRYTGIKTTRRSHLGGEYMLAVQAAKNFRIMTTIEATPEEIVQIIRRASR